MLRRQAREGGWPSRIPGRRRVAAVAGEPGVRRCHRVLPSVVPHTRL